MYDNSIIYELFTFKDITLCSLFGHLCVEPTFGYFSFCRRMHPGVYMFEMPVNKNFNSMDVWNSILDPKLLMNSSQNLCLGKIISKQMDTNRVNYLIELAYSNGFQYTFYIVYRCHPHLVYIIKYLFPNTNIYDTIWNGISNKSHE